MLVISFLIDYNIIIHKTYTYYIKSQYLSLGSSCQVSVITYRFLLSASLFYILLVLSTRISHNQYFNIMSKILAMIL